MKDQTATLYTVVYDVRGDRQKHDEWWRMIHHLPDGISVKASASFDALAKLDELEGEADMVSTERPNQTAARWEWHAPDFASLMLGRIELAQITKGRASDNWFWTLRFTQDDERPAFSAPTELAAKQACEAHAIKVLS